MPAAAAIDLLLLLLFAVQHTVMARPWFKRRWIRIVSEPAERASFVLAASLVLVLAFLPWRPIRGAAWNLPGPGADALWALFAAGWAVIISSTFLISHFDRFGLRQAVRGRRDWLHPGGIAYEERDLVRSLGETYTAYRARVLASIPRPSARSRRSAQDDLEKTT